MSQQNYKTNNDAMTNKIQKTILAGIIGTMVMTAVTLMAPMMGIPKMSPPEMLSAMLGVPVFAGWIMHFMIGIMFAFAYTYLCIFKWKIQNVYLKGLVFGVIIFIVAQIAMAAIGAMMQMPNMQGSKILSMGGSLIGHVIFGMVVSKTVGNAYCAGKACETR